MPHLVRVRENGLEFNVGSSLAEAKGLEVLDESAHERDGQRKPTTRDGGRKRKPKTSVSTEAAKKAASKSAGTTNNPPSEES